MENFLFSLNIMLPIFIMIALGYFLMRIKLLSDGTVKEINKVVFKVFLPLLVFINIYNTDISQSFDLDILLFALIGIFVQFLISLCTVLLSQKDNSKRGVMLQGMFRSNFVLFGIPVTTALFGESAAGIASVLIAVVIPLYNVLAVIALEMFNGKSPNFFKVLKGIITNPLIIASALGILCVTFGFRLPDVIYSTADTLSEIATPLAFVLLGASFYFSDVSNYVKELSLTLGLKLLIYPAFFLGAAVMFGFSGPQLAVLMTIFASPIAVSSFTMAQQMGGDDRLAAQLVVFSSIISIFTIFCIIFLFRQLSFF